MAVIPGVEYLWELSPRLILIPHGVLDISIQDLWDTLRTIEPGVLQMDDEHILEGAGKVELQGGLLTGIVLILRNARVLFDYHAVPLSGGTVTAVEPRGGLTTIVTDASATFITAGVLVGDGLLNATAAGTVPVVDVISETQLRVLKLEGSGRSPDQIEVGDTYTIFRTVDASVSGGDLVSLEIDGSPESVNLSPIFPVPFVNATVFQSTQAALLDAGITESGLAQAVWTESLEQYINMDSAARDVLVNQAVQTGKRSTDPNTGVITIRKTLPSGAEFVLTGMLWEDFDESIPYQGGGIEVQEELVETSP